MSDTPKRLNRRSFMDQVARATLLVGGAAGIVTGMAKAQNYTARTDTDSGVGADRSGYGHTNGDTRRSSDQVGNVSGETNCADNDSGPNSDQGGRGRRCDYTGYNDVDPSDPPGYGHRGHSGVTDRDSGEYVDRPGYGRGASRGQTGLIDGDSGPNGDRPGYGRGT